MAIALHSIENILWLFALICILAGGAYLALDIDHEYYYRISNYLFKSFSRVHFEFLYVTKVRYDAL